MFLTGFFTRYETCHQEISTRHSVHVEKEGHLENPHEVKSLNWALNETGPWAEGRRRGDRQTEQLSESASQSASHTALLRAP